MKLGYDINERKAGDVFKVLPDEPQEDYRGLFFVLSYVADGKPYGTIKGFTLGNYSCSHWCTFEWKYLGLIGTIHEEDWAKERIEVQELKKRIQELESVCQSLDSIIVCENLHHAKNEHHNYDQECPVEKKLKAIIKGGKE